MACAHLVQPPRERPQRVVPRRNARTLSSSHKFINLPPPPRPLELGAPSNVPIATGGPRRTRVDAALVPSLASGESVGPSVNLTCDALSSTLWGPLVGATKLSNAAATLGAEPDSD